MEGQHDGFPACEVYIGDYHIYEYDPLVTGKGVFYLGGGLDESVPNTKLNQPIP